MIIGSIPGRGSLVRRKRQRKNGGAKNVFILGMNYTMVNHEITTTLNRFGGEQDADGSNSFVFTKRAAAEKAWIWFVMRYS